jgi:hypothetical protein
LLVTCFSGILKKLQISANTQSIGLCFDPNLELLTSFV